MSGPARLRIDIWSDVMCPWCVIGYHQLRRTLAQLSGEIEAEVRWQPFELNPGMAPEGEDMAAHVARKYGRAPDAESTDRMARIAREAGYPMPLAAEAPGERRLWNTFAAHRLLAWALRDHGAEAQTRLKLALFDAHFLEARNVSDPQVLAAIAAATGLDGDEARAALGDPELAETVRAGERAAEAFNITGVPAMIVEGRYLIPGAQEPATYVQVLRRVVERSPAAA